MSTHQKVGRAGEGRGPSGRLRNFGAMKSDKLWETYRRMLVECPPDPEAISACARELEKRVLVHRSDTIDEMQARDEIGQILDALIGPAGIA